MDIQPTNQQPISDDQELAKVLAGLNQQADEASAPPIVEPQAAPAPDSTGEQSAVAPPSQPVVTPEPVLSPAPTAGNNLESIKQDALSELRPLVDKLNVAPEEKFDTYLLLLRSTDDQALIAPAHEAARNIADEARRAQALLDIIKEIDYLSGPQQAGV
jgi:hypothetical protein